MSSENDADLSNPWKDLPEIALPKQPEISSKEQEQKPRNTFPTHPKQESATLFLPLPDAVWQAGWMNGRPAHREAEVPEGEYGPHRPVDKTIHLYDPNLLPPFLEPGQTLVVHLANIQPDLYQVKVGISSGDPYTPYREFTTPESIQSRQVYLRWNDKLIWKQSHAPLYGIITGNIFPDDIVKEENTFSVYNAGTQPCALDVIWLEPLRRRNPPYGILFRDAEWLNREDSSWVKQVMVRVPMPVGSERPNFLPSIKRTAVHDFEKIVSAWEAAAVRFRELQDAGHPDAEVLRKWIPQLRKALDREMLPSVAVMKDMLSRPHDPQSLKSTAFVFGDVVQSWMLNVSASVSSVLEDFNETLPDAVLYTERWQQPEGQTASQAIKAWDGFKYLHIVGNAHRKYFEKFFPNNGRQEFTRLTRNRALQLKFSDLRAYHEGNRNFHSIDFHKSLVEGLMYSQHNAMVQGGQPGGPFFPSGSDLGSHHWHMIKHVFLFGGPMHRKSQANLLAANPSLNLGSSTWAVADNGKDSVHVLIHNPTSRNGKEAVLDLPLPWSGPTQIRHHQVKTRWSAATKVDRHFFTTELEAKPFANEQFNAEASEYKSLLKVPLELAGFHLLMLSPKDHQEPERQIQAPESVGYDALDQVEDLFMVHKQPPPPSWYRQSAIQHHFTQWKPYGPVSLRVGVDATRGTLRAWIPVEGSELQKLELIDNSSPLQEKSTLIGFPEDVKETRGFVYALYEHEVFEEADWLGMWVRAHPPADFDPPPDWYRSAPPARFYIGNFPKRQLIEIDYGEWIFLSSPADEWDGPVWASDPPARIHFQHDPETAQHPVLEIHDISAYTQRGKIGTPAVRAFVNTTEDGKLTLLLTGQPGSKASWRQRLGHKIDPGQLKRIVDEALIVSAENPEDPAPELVNTSLQLHEGSELLEIDVEAMPPPPSEVFLKAIKSRFPHQAAKIKAEKLSAVLWVEEAAP